MIFYCMGRDGMHLGWDGMDFGSGGDLHRDAPSHTMHTGKLIHQGVEYPQRSLRPLACNHGARQRRCAIVGVQTRSAIVCCERWRDSDTESATSTWRWRVREVVRQFTRKVRQFTLEVRQFTRKVRQFTWEVRQFTREVRNFRCTACYLDNFWRAACKLCIFKRAAWILYLRNFGVGVRSVKFRRAFLRLS